MGWDNYIYFALAALVMWVAGAVFAWRGNRGRVAAVMLSLAGLIVYTVFIVGLWKTLCRPPLRTMGETRLWYAFFMSIVGLAIFLRWRYRWILSFSTLLSAVFIVINILRPEIHDQTLMPALQSVWFVPHVTVYMLSYALLGGSFAMAIAMLVGTKTDLMPATDNLVRTGLALFTLAMIMGSVWAKQAWGNFWTWDPKETWALVTWLLYMLFIHMRSRWTTDRRLLTAILIAAFLSLQMCWWGINYLPAAIDSIHAYTR